MHQNISKPFNDKGFALIIALSLMSFVLLLLLSITTSVRVETQAANSQRATIEAKQNALLSLHVALGELQRTAGPDQRVTARAMLWSEDTRVNASLDPGTPDPRNWWVGVSHSDGKTALGTSPDDKAVTWLISGLKNTNSAGQLSDGFTQSRPISLLDTGSINTALLTGAPIEAGRLPVLNERGQETGSFAWIIDDEGTKAKLKSEDSVIANDTPALKMTTQRSVLPGAFDVGSLDSGALSGMTTLELAKVHSIEGLEITGLASAVIEDHYFDYTMSGYGVLSNVRKGGLKKDLTAAFENSSIFESLFPSTDEEKYLVMDIDKINDTDAAPLKQNGYIHWDIFKDYYNLKDSIVGGVLDATVFDKYDVTSRGNDHKKGKLGPHQISANGHPYKDFPVRPGLLENYKHSPITPVLGFMQQNAWVELEGAPPVTPGDPAQTFQSHVQLWTGIYNPYNVSVRMSGESNGIPQGPRLAGYPQTLITIEKDGTALLDREIATVYNNNASRNKLAIQSQDPLLLIPGATHVLGFSDNFDAKMAFDSLSEFSEDIANSTTKSAYRNFTDISGDSSALYDMTVEFAFYHKSYPYLYLGTAHHDSDNSTDWEASQVMFEPFAFDQSAATSDFPDGGPGKKIVKAGVPIGTGRMSDTAEAFYQFRLRTTRENTNALRPLIDSNPRAMWANPRWDSSLNLQALAGYSVDNSMIPSDRFIPMETNGNKGFSYYGADTTSFNGAEKVILFDIPREDLVSIGQLQHANAGRFSYEPSYIVGNSYANPRISLDQWNELTTDSYGSGVVSEGISGSFRLYDASYLVNEIIFDDATFTTIQLGQTEGYYSDLLSGTTLLANPRYQAYEPAGLAFDFTFLNQTGATGAGDHNAGMLLVDGSFNVNSTSIVAWEAFLSGTDALPVQKINADGQLAGYSAIGDVTGVRFPRVQSVLGDQWEASADENYWTGFRSLKPSEVHELAEAIVDEILLRGPFLSMGDFVNRKLENTDQGKAGTLQAALDATINDGISASFESAADNGTYSQISDDSTQAAGFPGQLLQGDILQALAPYMSARSDTFKIRAYGETTNPIDGSIAASSWCEAVVQRFPDPVNPLVNSVEQELIQPSSDFGRQFRIISFRWLTKDEV